MPTKMLLLAEYLEMRRSFQEFLQTYVHDNAVATYYLQKIEQIDNSIKKKRRHMKNKKCRLLIGDGIKFSKFDPDKLDWS